MPIIGIGIGPHFGGVPPVTPLTILGSANVKQWCRSDLGITLNGSTVSAWADQSGNGNHYTQSTAADQPTYQSAGGPNGAPLLLFDGTSDFMDSAGPDLPAPGTTPIYLWLVFKQVTWTGADRIFSAAATSAITLFQNSASPQINMFNAAVVNANTAATLNTNFRLECLFNNATSDYLKIGSTNATGASAGNTDAAAGLRLARQNSAGAAFGNIGLTEVIVYTGTAPTAAQRAALDAYCTSRYGAGLV